MAWEDRNHKEKQQAMREARKRAATEDKKTYVVEKDGARYTVKGNVNARIIAGRDGTIREK